MVDASHIVEKVIGRIYLLLERRHFVLLHVVRRQLSKGFRISSTWVMVEAVCRFVVMVVEYFTLEMIFVWTFAKHHSQLKFSVRSHDTVHRELERRDSATRLRCGERV
jgi:hypothetical protein